MDAEFDALEKEIKKGIPTPAQIPTTISTPAITISTLAPVPQLDDVPPAARLMNIIANYSLMMQ